MNILKSFQESATGLGMGFGYVISKLGGDMQNSTIKAGGVSSAATAKKSFESPQSASKSKYDLEDPGTPASVVATIQKSIGESVAGWRYGFAHVAGKAAEAVGGAQKGIEKSLAGWGMGISHVAGKTSEAFGNIGGGLSSFKYPLYALVAVFLFIAVMVSIGYSGVGAPVARVAEKEYVRRR